MEDVPENNALLVQQLQDSGEPGLRQTIGGASVMARQLRRLLDTPANVTVQVVPVGELWHPGVAGPFIRYEFAESSATVHIEPYRSSAFVYNEHDVADFTRAVETIRQEVAMSPEDSAELIADVSKELGRTQRRYKSTA